MGHGCGGGKRGRRVGEEGCVAVTGGGGGGGGKEVIGAAGRWGGRGGKSGDGGEVGGDDCEGEEGDVVLFRQAKFGACGCQGGAESAVEVSEGNAEVDNIIGSGLEQVGFEKRVLIDYELLAF